MATFGNRTNSLPGVEKDSEEVVRAEQVIYIFTVPACSHNKGPGSSLPARQKRWFDFFSDSSFPFSKLGTSLRSREQVSNRTARFDLVATRACSKRETNLRLQRKPGSCGEYEHCLSLVQNGES